jgi:hypothetical protein
MSESIQHRSQQPEEGSEETAISRRRLLKILTATGGAVAASTMLPGEWAKPLVEVGVLSAHAQLSPEEPVDLPDTVVELEWDFFFDNGDGLHLRCVGDAATCDEGTPNTPTMTWVSEEVYGFDMVPDTLKETITIISNDATGDYEVYVKVALINNDQPIGEVEVAPQAILSITLPDQLKESKDVLAAIQEFGTWVKFATIHFGSLTLTWHVC